MPRVNYNSTWIDFTTINSNYNQFGYKKHLVKPDKNIYFVSLSYFYGIQSNSQGPAKSVRYDHEKLCNNLS